MLQIKERRKAAGFTVEALAFKSGLSVKTIQRTEKTGQASARTLQAIANALNVNPPDLFSTEVAS